MFCVPSYTVMTPFATAIATEGVADGRSKPRTGSRTEPLLTSLAPGVGEAGRTGQPRRKHAMQRGVHARSVRVAVASGA
jgi:hypothetical protein